MLRPSVVLLAVLLSAEAAAGIRYTRRTRIDLAEIEVLGSALEPGWRGLGAVELAAPGQLDGMALYRRAWRQIDAGRWRAGARSLQGLVHACDAGRVPDTYRDTMREVALDDLVRVGAVAGLVDDAVLEVVSMGGAELLQRLGAGYVQRDDHRRALAVFRLLAAEAEPAERPEHEVRIFEALRGLGKDGDAVAQVPIVVESLLAARADDDAPAEVEDRVEEVLRRAAMDYHKRSKRRLGAGRSDDLHAARDLYDVYLRLFPELVAHHVRYPFYLRFYYAEVLWKLEAYGPAAQQYERVAAFVPFDRKEEQIVESAVEGAVYARRELLAGSSSDVERERFLEAARRYLQTFAHGSDTGAVRYQVGRVLLELGRNDRARLVFQELVAESSGPPSTASDIVVGARLGLGALALAAREWAAAARSFEAALASRHDDRAALDGLARAYRELGSEQTVEGYLRSIGVEPERPSRRTRPIRVVTSTPVTIGSPSIVDLRAVIARNLGQVRTCYERELQRDRHLEGRVTVRWSVGANGAVQHTAIAETRIRSSRLMSCLLTAVAQWRFLPPHGVVDVTCPFVLRRTPREPSGVRR